MIQRKEIAGLVTFIEEPPDPEQTIVLLHGYGANGQDLIPITEIMSMGKETRFIFPQGPNTVPFAPGYNGYAWFPLDQVALEQALDKGTFRDYRNHRPAGLDAARDRITDFLQELELQGIAKTDEIILGGFSQGAMLSADYIFGGRNKVKGLVFLSGSLLDKDNWFEGMKTHGASLPVFQSHGKQDPLLSFEFAVEMKELMEAAGITVDWNPFQGTHEIPIDVIRALNKFLNQISR